MIIMITKKVAVQKLLSGKDVCILPTQENRFPKGDERRRLEVNEEKKLCIRLFGKWKMTDSGSLHEVTDFVGGGKYAEENGLIRVWIQE